MTLKSASGQQLAEQNLGTFLAWHEGKSNDGYLSLANRGVLSRIDIAKKCGLARSFLDQNPRVQAALGELEEALRSRLVFPALAERDETVPRV